MFCLLAVRAHADAEHACAKAADGQPVPPVTWRPARVAAGAVAVPRACAAYSTCARLWMAAVIRAGGRMPAWGPAAPEAQPAHARADSTGVLPACAAIRTSGSPHERRAHRCAQPRHLPQASRRGGRLATRRRPAFSSRSASGLTDVGGMSPISAQLAPICRHRGRGAAVRRELAPGIPIAFAQGGKRCSSVAGVPLPSICKGASGGSSRCMTASAS